LNSISFQNGRCKSKRLVEKHSLEQKNFTNNGRGSPKNARQPKLPASFWNLIAFIEKAEFNGMSNRNEEKDS
jgi:hypothetical protein